METWNEWTPPLVNFAILYAIGAAGGIGGMYGFGKPVSFALGLEAVWKGGASGGAAGIVALELLTKGWAIAFAIFTGAGWIKVEEITAAAFAPLKKLLGSHDERKPTKP